MLRFFKLSPSSLVSNGPHTAGVGSDIIITGTRVSLGEQSGRPPRFRSKIKTCTPNISKSSERALCVSPNKRKQNQGVSTALSSRNQTSTPYLSVGHREHGCPCVELAHQAGLGHAERLLLHGLDTHATRHPATTKTTISGNTVAKPQHRSPVSNRISPNSPVHDNKHYCSLAELKTLRRSCGRETETGVEELKRQPTPLPSVQI